MPKQSILDLPLANLEAYLLSIGEKPFRGQQIFSWIYQQLVLDFDAMKNVPHELRRRLNEDFYFPAAELQKIAVAADGTKKFLFRLQDGQQIETVLIPAARRTTVCVSCQAGCKFNCRFCASGIGGWVRNLTAGEILIQILKAGQQGKGAATHVVFMGTGEPLDNWKNVRAAIELINFSKGMNIAARRITVSTCGLIPGMKELAAFDRQVELAISLHGYNDEVRSQLMPVNKTFPLAELIRACRAYVHQTNRQITFEYVLIDGLTATSEAPAALGKLLRGLTCKVNLIPYNPVPEFHWQAPSRNAIYRFCDALGRHGVHATIRWSKGEGAEGACGQLRRVKSEE